MSDVINLAVKTVYQGYEYSGITINPGVDLDLQPAACDETRKVLNLINGDKNPYVFYDCISSYEISPVAVKTYLQIFPEL